MVAPVAGEDLPRLLQAIDSPSRPRALRAKAILRLHAGHSEDEVARQLGLPMRSVAAWRDAYAHEGLAGLFRTRGQRPKDAEARTARVEAALAALAGEQGLTVRRVAALAGVPATTTYRLMRHLEARARPAPALPPLPAASRVMIVGCGGSGGHTLDRLGALGLEGASTIILDTDKAGLDLVDADTKLLVAKATAHGRGSGGDVHLASRGAEASAGVLAQLVAGAQVVFVTTGLGGGTGTGAAPIVARLARQSGALVVGLVSLPFHVERARLAKAEEGLRALEQEADRVVVLANDRLLRYVPNLPLEQAFRVVDTLLAEVLQGTVDTLVRPSLLNLDLAAMRRVLAGGGRAVLLYGEARAGDTRGVVREALQHAFADAEVARASGALAHLGGGPELTLAEVEEVAEGLSARLAPGASLVWGARSSPALAHRLRLTVVATGSDLRGS